ncbi:MAG: cyclic nucleotide-binding domain-containing protein [Desulfobacteraceae bacterium]|nr:cyclic nucleotide-binding domain-containing protein [Desulfobacteraceae bacterium]
MHLLNIEEIKQLAIFRDLAPEEWAEIYPLLRHVWVIEGEQLIREGDRAHTFFVILNGHFMIHYRDGRAITLNQKGDIIGWSSVISPFQYTGSVTALTHGDLLAIPGARFLELLQSNAPLGDKLIKKISEIVQMRETMETES